MEQGRGLHNIIRRSVSVFTVCLAAVTLTGCKLPGFLYDAKCWFDEKAEDIRYLFEEEDYDYTPVVIADTDDDEKPKGSGIEVINEVTEQVIELEDGETDDGQTDEDLATEMLNGVLKDDRYYAYHTLTVEEQKVYKILYASLFDFGEKAPMPTKNADMVNKVFDCVLADNPELFYVKGYNLIKYERGGVVEQLAVSGMYTMTRSEAKSHQERADRYVDICLTGAPAGDDDYQKIKYLYEYIIRNTEYDLDAENGQNYLSVFENGRSVCQGYASALQYMMFRMGLNCTVVRGITHENERHAWNLVKADGDYYFVDVTWGDMSYEMSADRDMSALPQPPEISYDYLCVTTSDIRKTHKIDSAFPVPECISRKDYYYVREGNYFEAVDEEQLRNVFDMAYARGNTMVTIKCSDEMLYDDMTSYLTGDGHIFDYLRGSKNVNYVTLENLNELIFYL